MKKYLLLILLPLIFSCSQDAFNNNNPYLPNYGFSTTINMNLPQYSQLLYTANAVYVNNAGAGIRGIFVFNTGNENYVAFDAACPNQALSSCSTMTINGIKALCSCDGSQYSFFSGQAEGQQYPMKQYRVQRISATSLRIYN
jgi:nitrite reductase/ring-hydroxylating ferredoxin subunit